MPFRDPFNSYYKLIIEPAVVEAGLAPQRGDSLFRPSPIMADVWQMIQDATVLVAELTEKNANVFYELGLAHAVGKPVILISETINDIPYDLQSLRVILYDKANPSWGDRLRETLAESIGEVLADTVSAVPPMFRKVVESQAPAESEMEARLSKLEMQIAAADVGRLRGSQHSLGAFRERLKRSSSMEEAVLQVAEMIRIRRYPSGLVRAIVAEVFATGMAEDVWKAAREMAFSGSA